MHGTLYGPAIGFALTQSWLVAMAVFVSLGVGMAFPIRRRLLTRAVSIFTQTRPWMETFKQFMAFPLYASALFFLWVLGNQVGVMGMSLVLGMCVVMAFAAWLYQRRFTMGPLLRKLNYGISLAALVLAIYLVQTPFLQSVPATSDVAANEEAASQDCEVFSAQRLEELQSAGKPVFVNMTAAWYYPSG